MSLSEKQPYRHSVSVAGAVIDDEGRFLAIQRRDNGKWEIPGGILELGETPEEGVVREVLEETGWQPGSLTALTSYHPTNGLSDQRFHVFLAAGATHIGEPTDPSESERIEWVPLDEVRRIVTSGEMLDGLSFTGVLYALNFAGLG